MNAEFRVNEGIKELEFAARSKGLNTIKFSMRDLLNLGLPYPLNQEMAKKIGVFKEGLYRPDKLHTILLGMVYQKLKTLKKARGATMLATLSGLRKTGIWNCDYDVIKPQ